MVAKLYSKARATILLGYKFTAKFSEKKIHKLQMEKKTRS